jgi:hypothetical protein
VARRRANRPVDTRELLPFYERLGQLPSLGRGKRALIDSGPPIVSGKPAGEGHAQCKWCGFRVRGAGHADGAHHLGEVARCQRRGT